MPKTILNKNKDEIIKDMNTSEIQKPKVFKMEMEKADAKVKQFVREFSGF